MSLGQRTCQKSGTQWPFSRDIGLERQCSWRTRTRLEISSSDPPTSPTARGNGHVARLPYRGTRWGGGRNQFFLFPTLFPSAGSEAALLDRKWDTILSGGTLISLLDTSLMMERQKVDPITGWEEAASLMESWELFCTVFLGDDGRHLATFDMFHLV